MFNPFGCNFQILGEQPGTSIFHESCRVACCLRDEHLFLVSFTHELAKEVCCTKVRLMELLSRYPERRGGYDQLVLC